MTILLLGRVPDCKILAETKDQGPDVLAQGGHF